MLQKQRELAVRRVKDGYTQAEVAAFLGVSVKSVQKWVSAARKRGTNGLRAKPHRGRRPRLSAEREREVLKWLDQAPADIGVTAARWSAPLLAKVIEQRWCITFHPRYLNAWLKAHRRPL